MTFGFAATWAAAWGALLFVIFMLDITVGPFALRWIPSPGLALCFGAVWAAFMLGPVIWVSLRLANA